MSRKYVLIITKNAELAEKLTDILNNDEYIAVCCDDCKYAAELNNINNFSIILYDSADINFEHVRAISEELNIPFLALCGKDETVSVKTHWIADPLRGNRLISEIRSICASYAEHLCSGNIFKFGDIVFCRSTGAVTKHGQDIPLSLRELELLDYLCTHADQAVSKADIMNNVWHKSPNSTTLNVHIMKLRKKLEDNPENPVHIITVRNEGFMLRKRT